MNLMRCWKEYHCCVPTLVALALIWSAFGAKIVLAGVAADVLSRLLQVATRLGYVNGYS